ncbi:prephenate dehydratase [Egibacter rhizosphaerae]|uniref:Prephenate dehydratase n=1 Tax=Egibacter rhizosphaerae TaxID=1670831 RepID=A0A411YET2_9ACTN|nr:prephenate dehydratase [Egibacter rhizosphaerae]QBI19710.1 prephenate dehydratase [Egibacter rhizosphaerae]
MTSTREPSRPREERPAGPRVAFLGPEGTFASEAARLAAPDAARDALSSIGEILDAVRAETADLGVVPLENSIEGSVNLTLDELAFGEPGAMIRGEVTLPVTMNLLTRPGSQLSDIKAVRSQPHALAQCREWLETHLPAAQHDASTSTAEAAREAAESDGAVAALGTQLAAELYGLGVLARDVHDYPGNTTRFVLLSRSMHPATGADKTSLVVFFGEDRPGLLLRILEEFALRGINLTKIESRPTKQQLGEYCIFIDCAGHVSDARVGEALRSVHRHVANLRVLGSYPRADAVRETPPVTDTETAYEDARQWYEGLLSQVGEARGGSIDGGFAGGAGERRDG